MIFLIPKNSKVEAGLSSELIHSFSRGSFKFNEAVLGLGHSSTTTGKEKRKKEIIAGTSSIKLKLMQKPV